MEEIISDIEHLPEPPKLRPYTPDERILFAIEQAKLHREVIKIPAKDMTNELFDFLWSEDHPYPFVVTGIKEALQYSWSPELFTKILGDESCLIRNCETGTDRKATVGEFFSKFGLDLDSTERVVECLKVVFKLAYECVAFLD